MWSHGNQGLLVRFRWKPSCWLSCQNFNVEVETPFSLKDMVKPRPCRGLAEASAYLERVMGRDFNIEANDEVFKETITNNCG
jgi:hypothetical protein